MKLPGHPGVLRRFAVGLFALGIMVAACAPGAAAHLADGDDLDPVRNQPLPCDVVRSVALPARSAHDIRHVTNKCGIVGTDVEFQSRTDAAGRVHDYAFVGTMGAGFRIYDITDPRAPTWAGAFNDPGWQNDIQVRGNIAVTSFDLASPTSTCLASQPGSNRQGVDIIRLIFDPVTAKFRTRLITCVANAPGGAHNSTIHPSGRWLAISNASDWAIDLVDLRNLSNGQAVHRYRFIDASTRSASTCPSSGVTFTCVVVKRPNGTSASGLWRPHDAFFSRDGRTMYVAAINSTFIVDVSGALSGSIRTISIIPNVRPGTDPDSRYNIEISHQADVTADGKMLVIGDERGGGLSNDECNTDPNGVIGGLHFYALQPIDIAPEKSAGATPASPKKIGVYFYPNPGLLADPLQSAINQLPRTERGCTAHVFRLGGNGTSSPGPAAPGYDGVARIGWRQLTLGWYGAGTWYVSFHDAPDSQPGDHVQEDRFTTWGNTLGWNVQAGADTWSAKAYKDGFIFTGDMLRGFDVFHIDECHDVVACILP